MKRMLWASIERMKPACIRPVFISGNFAVTRRMFEIEDNKSSNVRVEELAHQLREGELMTERQFFYDPPQFRQSLRYGTKAALVRSECGLTPR